MELKEFTKYINSYILDLVIIKGKKYRVCKYEGKVSEIQNILILICYEVNCERFKDPI